MPLLKRDVSPFPGFVFGLFTGVAALTTCNLLFVLNYLSVFPFQRKTLAEIFPFQRKTLAEIFPFQRGKLFQITGICG